MKTSTAKFLKNGRIFFQAYSETIDGLNILDGPVFEAADQDAHHLGTTILNAMEHCRFEILDPMEWRNGIEESPMLKAAGFKSWNQMMKNSKSVNITIVGNQAEFLPTRFKGTKGDEKGYSLLEEEKLMSDLYPENLGRTLLKAFVKCEHYLFDN